MFALTKLVSRLEALSVDYVADQKGLAVTTIGLRVKPAIDLIPTISVRFLTEPQPLGRYQTYSVRTVMYRLPLEGVESFSTKCPAEKEVQPHEYVKITPVVEEQVFDAMETLKLTKRLTLCTNCGNLRLIN